MGSKSWLYRGLILKSEIKVMGIENYEIAVSFKKNSYISSSKFKYITGIQYEDIPDLSQEIIGGFNI